MRRIYKNETDHFSAVSAEEANRMQCEMYGMRLGEVDLFEEPPLDDEKVIAVTFKDGAEDGRAHPAWADTDPDATVTKVQLSGFIFSEVSAPARVWAKHEEGMVCSTEF